MTVDPVYILKQPKHLTLTVVQVYDNFPKEREFQVIVDSLVENTDVVFVFSGRKKIDYRKFTTLHRASGYIVCKDSTRSENLLGVVGYFREIYKKHISYLFMNEWGMVSEESFEKIHDWNASVIVAPLITPKRYSEESLADIYIPTIKKTWWGGYKKEYKKGCDYQTHYSAGPYVYMKDLVIGKILEKSRLEEYATTFVEDDPNIMLASLVVDLGIKTLSNYEI